MAVFWRAYRTDGKWIVVARANSKMDAIFQERHQFFLSAAGISYLRKLLKGAGFRQWSVDKETKTEMWLPSWS